jgi:hypothetical protein
VFLRLVVVAFVAAGCANADVAPDAGGDNPIADAATTPDARSGDAAPSVDGAPAPIYDASPAPDYDASPAPNPDAAPCTPVWTQLLNNADFDAGATSWTETSSGGDIISDSHPLTPHSGAYVARMAGFNNADTSLYQSVTVPADATGLRLSGFRCYVTSEPLGTPYDFLDIEIRDSGSNLLETLVSRDNTHAGATCSWEPFSYTAADPHAGQTIDLSFHGTADESSPTSFYHDSLIFEALACP